MSEFSFQDALSKHEFDWDDQRNQVRLNPALNQDFAFAVEQIFFRLCKTHRFPGVLGVTSSGTTRSENSLRLYFLPKRAFLASAHGVNQHLRVQQKDVFLGVLPMFHVGGLGLSARAHAANAMFYDRSLEKWSAQKFCQLVDDVEATVSSLVPTQVYDLVKEGLVCPPTLRAVVVGGGALDLELYRKARQLGFPLLPSYGMTELCSQVATASLDSLLIKPDNIQTLPPLELLNHVRTISRDGRVLFLSGAAFSAAVDVDQSEKPGELAVENNFELNPAQEVHTADLLEVYEQNLKKCIRIIGRQGQSVKINGEWVQVGALNVKWAELSQDTNCVLLAEPHERSGRRIVLICEWANYHSSHVAVEKFNQQVLPVARISATYVVNQIPKTPLGKINFGQLSRMLQTPHLR